MPATGFCGGLWLSVTMPCAVATHIAVIGGSPVPASVSGLLSAFVAWRQRPVSRIGAAG